MKTFKQPVLLVLTLFIAFSCKKEVKTATINAVELNNSSDASNSCTARWFGTYSDGNYPQIDAIQDKDFIANGSAKLSNSPFSYYYTSIQLTIPGCHNFR